MMKRDVAHDKHFSAKIEEEQYFDFSTPYGYGGWIIEGYDTGQLFADYEKWCQNNKVICEFVRFHPVLMNHVFSAKSYEVTTLGHTVALDLSSPEVIWANMTSKNRNVIRKAQKNGVKIYNGRYPEIFETFRVIYNDTMDKDFAGEYYYFSDKFYETILDDLVHNAQLFYAVHEGVVVAASIMLAANSRMSYHLSGSLREYAGLAPTNLLLYEAALWGCANGCKTLHLGGGVGSSQDSLYKFKKAFNRKDDLTFYIGKKVFLPSIYDKLIDIRRIEKSFDLDTKYFPAYRA